MKLVFIGKPGSGKGTQAKILSKKLKISHISTGDLFRQSTGEFSKLVHSYIDGGNFVPDDLTIKMLRERILKEDCKNGFIFDGFPRTLPQAEMLEKEIKIDYIIDVHISDEEAIKRMSGRRICKKCGELYNLNTNHIPKKKNMCDKCGGILFKREDQTSEAIKKRIEIHYKEVKPILKKFNPIIINGEQSIDKVTEDILKILE
ncbi:nucleoside monophosphate kinase [Candidatus Pacearchaeota archaeon]|nr:nucleoside monophosphate kinase [Candidatus Pacearchaeota archaeon]